MLGLDDSGTESHLNISFIRQILMSSREINAAIPVTVFLLISVILYGFYDNLSGEYKHEVGAFIEAEKEFIVRKIIPERKLELILCKAAIRIVQDQDVLKSKKMADYLDKIFKEKIEEFCEKKSLFSEKIRNDFLKKKSKIDPIEGLRAATMGRLSEIGIVSWEIDEHSQSVYKVRDDKLSEIIHQAK